MGEEIIRYEEVSKYFGTKRVLNKVNFSVKQGEIFGIIGMSGSGKTTILNLLVSFIKPEKGDIRIRSDLLLGMQDKGKKEVSIYSVENQMKKLIGFAAQAPSFYEKLNAEENLSHFGSLYGLPRKIVTANATVLLKIIGLYNAKKTLGNELSGGMQKRLDIACALMHNPKILILDEPTSNLDPLLRKQMWKLIKAINKKGTTVILASHFLDEIDSLCDKVAIIDNGIMVFEGSPNDLKNKYSKNEEINIETSPGDYDDIIEQLQSNRKIHITDFDNKGHKLTIHTPRAETVLHELLHVVEQRGELLLDVEVNKASMKGIFENLGKEDKPKAQR